MDTIKFANGAVYDCSYLSTGPIYGETSNTAFIALANVAFAEAAAIFANPELTREMEWGSYTLVGYTQLQGIYVQPYGVQAVLRGGHDERRE
ncbi:MAG: hypothetical protein IKI81_04630 [Selenomonadaceae bacterium]|nr:hypothetical protein [Selenomonadaceae bacterium]